MPRYDSPEGNARLLAEVRRIDGRPAALTRVFLTGPEQGGNRWRTSGRTDLEGAILFEYLPPGPAFLHVREDGFLMPGELEVTLHAGTTTMVLVNEDAGLPLHVRVLDEHGCPVAGAALEFDPDNAGDFVWLEGDVQQFGFYTDQSGCFFVPRLPAGTVRVEARLGSREASGSAEAGGTIELRLSD